MASRRRVVTTAALLGVLMSVLVAVAKGMGLLSNPLSDVFIFIIWPTYVFLLAFAGPPTALTIAALIVSALLNGVICAAVAYVCALIVSRVAGTKQQISGKRCELDATTFLPDD